MKFCPRPFKQAYIFPNGDVRACGWTYQCIGNLVENSMEDIWSSEQAEKVRDAVRDGSFSLCNKVACPYLANDTLPDMEAEVFERATKATALPVEFNAAYDYICNHSCPSCRHEIFKPDDQYKKNMEIITEKLIPIMDKANSISADGNGDCFASPYIMDMLKRIQPEKEKCQIQLETNGVLCDEEHWEKLEHLFNRDITITVTPNSFDRRTYKYLSGGHDNLDKLIENLHFLSRLRKEGKIKKFDISIVVQDTNYRELPDFVKRCIDEFECDTVVIKPIFYWFALTHEEYWFKDILNPKHPYFNEYMEVLKDPILKHPKVFFWGGDQVHEAKDHPATSFKVYFDAFAEILKREDPSKALELALVSKEAKEVALYGVNDMSEMLFNLLKKSNIKVKAFVDRYAKVDTFCGLNVQKMQDFQPDMFDTIIVSNFIFMENIERDLRFRKFDGNLIAYCDLLK